MLERKPLPLHLLQPLAQTPQLFLLLLLEGGKFLEMVSLKKAQPFQLPVSHLQLGGSSLVRLLTCGALSAGNSEVRLKLRDPGGLSCKPAKMGRQ